MTYGRIGPRRHELLKVLKVPDVPVSSKALGDVLDRMSDPANENVPHPSQQLLALIRSQNQRKETVFGRTALKYLEPQIPETNAWGRPMPIKRVRNIKRRWYVEVLDRVMPPLPENEWDILRKMVVGETPFQGSVVRRGSSQEDEVGLEAFRTDKGQLSRPHELSPRYMRRLWAKIFQQCPLMKRNEKRPLGWDVVWPELKRDTAVGLDGATEPLDNGMFDGVDERGKIQVAAGFG